MNTITKDQTDQNYVALAEGDKLTLERPVEAREDLSGEGCSYCSCENACGKKGD